MDIVIVVLAAVAGLFIASATWMVAKNQAGKRPLFGPVLCGEQATLPATAWLPLFGFGTARACPGAGEPQSSRRLTFELAVAAYAALGAYRHEHGLDVIALLFFLVPLLVILLVDAWTRLIHTNVIGLGILFGWVFALLDGPSELMRSAIAMIAAVLVFGGIFFLAIAIYRNSRVVPFGLGDVYLAGMIGAMVRLDGVVLALFYGILLAGATLGILLVTKRVNRKQAVPYGPFLVLGALIALVV